MCPLDVDSVLVGAFVLMVYGSLALATVPDVILSPLIVMFCAAPLELNFSLPSTDKPASSMLKFNLVPILYLYCCSYKLVRHAIC